MVNFDKSQSVWLNLRVSHHFVTVGLAFVFELGFKVRIGVIVYTLNTIVRRTFYDYYTLVLLVF